MKHIKMKYGFTLIELLVVVIIIAVLSAVAMPMYKHAVLKSRFSTVMPMTKSIADANEVYYLGRGYYAQKNEEDVLDVEKVNAENTSVVLSAMEGYDYAMGQRSDVPGVHYIQYQKYSPNYPSEIHCEAEDENADAQWLCQNIGGTQNLGQTVTAGYTTYIISGTGAGLPLGADEDEGETISCNKAQAIGWSCNITTNDQGKQEKKMCKEGPFGYNYCVTKTYDEETGGYTRISCRVDGNGVCAGSWTLSTHDKDGHVLTERYCNKLWAGTCNRYDSSGKDYYYENGKLVAERFCASLTDDKSKCATYLSWSNYDYIYEDGKLVAQRPCAKITADGSKCETYRASDQENYDYLYEDGNQVGRRQCATLTEDGSQCATYQISTDRHYDYLYENGNKVGSRECAGLTADGSKCNTYNLYDSKDYLYENGNLVGERKCNTLTTDGSKCATYSSSGNYDYYYDANGNKVGQRLCATLTADGSRCATYQSADNYDYLVDENGKQIVSITCNTVGPQGECNG